MGSLHVAKPHFVPLPAPLPQRLVPRLLPASFLCSLPRFYKFTRIFIFTFTIINLRGDIVHLQFDRLWFPFGVKNHSDPVLDSFSVENSHPTMTKINTLRRFILPCFAPALAAPPTATPLAAKKRISTSLRDDIYNDCKIPEPHLDLDLLRKVSGHVEDDGFVGDATDSTSPVSVAPPRPSKTMVIGTIFGPRRGHVWFCIQHDRLSTKPSLLLELSIPTQQLVKEMQSSELVRIALECSADSEPVLSSCPLRSVPMWTLSCNGRKLGFATKRKASEQNRSMLKTMQSMTVGAGVIPSGIGSAISEEIMYMRANYEHVVGSADSESFHLINPDECSGQELSLFLLRTR